MIIVDASAIGALVLREDEHEDPAERFASLLAQPLSAPPHFPVEIASLLLKAVRRGRIDAAERVLVFSQTEELVGRVRLTAPPPLTLTFDLAEQFGLSAYDASYLAIAMTTNCPLLTLDGALRRAASSIGLAA